MEIILNAQNFDAEVIRSNEPVIVDFYRPLCGPCLTMAPIFEKLSILFIKDGKIIGTETGYMDKETFVSKIQNYFEK